MHLLRPSWPSRIATSICAARRFMGTEIKKHYLRVLVADVDDACAAATVVIIVVRTGANDRCEKAPARPHTRLRKDEGREEKSTAGTTAGGEARESARIGSGRQGFVSLSVGNQVSGPVGRPLSISVLLAVYNTCRARVVISRPRPFPPATTLSRSLLLVIYLLRRPISAATGEGMMTRVRQREENSY